MENKKEKNINKNFLICGSDGGTAFTIAVFVPLILTVIVSLILTISGAGNNKDFLNSAFYQYLSFSLGSVALCICLIYFLKKKHLDFALTLGFQKCHIKYYGIALLMLFGALFGLSWVNDLFIKSLTHLGFHPAEIVLPKRHFGDFVLCMLIVGILPAFFEECIFRGIILNGARRLGTLFAVLVVGGLFAVYHHNPVQTIYQFIMGVAFTLIVIKSGSIIPSILIHFLNNAYILIYYFVAPENYVFPLWFQWTFGVLGIIAFVFSILFLIFKCEKPKRDIELEEGYNKICDRKRERRMFLIMSLAGVVGCVAMWIIALVG